MYAFHVQVTRNGATGDQWALIKNTVRSVALNNGQVLGDAVADVQWLDRYAKADNNYTLMVAARRPSKFRSEIGAVALAMGADIELRKWDAVVFDPIDDAELELLFS